MEKPIKNYPAYTVDLFGTIRRAGKEIHTYDNNRGYDRRRNMCFADTKTCGKRLCSVLVDDYAENTRSLKRDKSVGIYI